MSEITANGKEPIFTNEDRIRQLVEIDKTIAKMLRTSGEAIQALANRPVEDDQPPPSDEEARNAFTAATSQYFSLLSSVDVNIRRQIWALEEANIVSSGSVDKDAQVGKDRAGADPANLGSLDVGWLNSRNDKVGKEMEAELWEKANLLMAAKSQDGRS